MSSNPRVQTPDHKARARRAWPILVKRARAGLPPLTYGELSGTLGLHARSAQWFLGVIQTHCSTRGLPPLQALAVNKATGVPGVGYVGSGRSPAQHARAVAAVHVYGKKWPIAAPHF